MKKEKRKEFLLRILRLYTLQVTLITVLLIILGKLLDSDRVFSYEAFLSPLIYALIGTAVALITHTEKELSVRQLVIREIISLLLIEAVIILIALRVETIPTDRSWVLPGIVLGIAVIFLLSSLIMYFADKKEAEKLTADLARYQHEQAVRDTNETIPG